MAPRCRVHPIFFPSTFLWFFLFLIDIWWNYYKCFHFPYLTLFFMVDCTSGKFKEDTRPKGFWNHQPHQVSFLQLWIKVNKTPYSDCFFVLFYVSKFGLTPVLIWAHIHMLIRKRWNTCTTIMMKKDDTLFNFRWFNFTFSIKITWSTFNFCYFFEKNCTDHASIQ